MHQTTETATTYTRFADIPFGLRTKTAWKGEGRKVVAGATPAAYYDSYWHKTSYELLQHRGVASRHR